MAIDFNFFNQLPEYWETGRIKNILDYNHHYPIGDGDHGSIKPEMYQDEGIPYIRVQNLSWGFDINYDNMVFISDEVNLANSKSILLPNDILIAKTGATVGKMAIVPKSIKQANTTSSVGKITINHNLFNHKYFAYQFLSPMFQEQIKEKAYQKSAQPGFNIDDLIEFKVVIPPINTQNDISNYLDKQTAEIDENIAKNKELISLLEEKKAAIINQAVTKGLDPDVPMKDSGIGWIGEIPEYWAVIPLKRACSKITDGSHHSPETQYDGKYYITVKDVLEKEINFENANKISIDDFNDLKKNSCQPLKGDVLLSKDGTIGKCVVVDYNDFVILSSLGLLRPNILINSNYLRYFLISDINIKQMFSLIRGSALKRLTISIIKELEIILPSLQEQEQIIDYLDKETSKIDKSIKKLENNISLLEEYKDSLIHHVVTGKIDVRDEI